MVDALTVADSGALLSEDGAFRYKLWRIWDASLPALPIVMFNPSTADAKRDDPTIRRCVGFAWRWRSLAKIGGIVIGNLYAYRATDPQNVYDRLKEMSADQTIGPENDRHLQEIVEAAVRADVSVLCAWGNPAYEARQILGPDDKLAGVRDYEVFSSMIAAGARVMTLGFNRNGTPKHPVRLPYSQTLHRWYRWDDTQNEVHQGAPCGATKH